MKEALYYTKLSSNRVQCNLCPNNCIMSNGQESNCLSRKNTDGTLYATNYAKVVAMHIDPIEKKPLYHYYPGSHILSLGPNSCNLHCSFCQNYEISQFEQATETLSPYNLLEYMLSKELKQIAFTYTEPLTWFEYIIDCGTLFVDHGIRIVLITNGYINPEPLNEILPFIDAMNIDLKSINPRFYQEQCRGGLTSILETIKVSHKKCHIELTNLLIPNLNDGNADIQDLISFVADIDNNIPLHFSKYYPRWKCSEPSTSDGLLYQAYTFAIDKLNYVYLGNISSYQHHITNCPKCKTKLIERDYCNHIINRMLGNVCYHCGNIIHGCFNA